MVVVPGAVAAQDIPPTTYAKLPFAIIGNGLYLLESILDELVTAELLPSTLEWLPALMPLMGDFAAGPLAWTVDMLAWGVSLVGALMGAVQDALDAMGIDLGDIDLGGLTPLFDTIACGLFQPWSANVTGADFTPCGTGGG
jgi:hypothetical protein